MKIRKVLFGLITGILVSFGGSLAAQKANYNSANFVEIGPDNVGGRVTSLVVMNHPTNTTSTIYAGAASGGLYQRSNLLSDAWEYIPCYTDVDEKIELTLPISCMTKFNDSLILIGTGEYDYRVGMKTAQMAARGRGLYVFNVNSEKFTLVPGTNPDMNIDHDFAAINSIQFMADHGNNYFFIATGKGLFRAAITELGQLNGSNFEQVFEGPVRSLVVSNTTNRAFFTSEGHLYKIGDVINNDEPTDISGSCSAFGDNASTIDLAMAPSDQTYLYAMACDTNGVLSGLYLSRNTNTWQIVSTNTVIPFDASATSATSGAVVVSPFDPLHVFIAGSSIWSGKGYVENSPFQWSRVSYNENQLNGGNYMSQVYMSMSFVHSGIHQIVGDANYDGGSPVSSEFYYIVTDGGVYFAPTSEMSAFLNFNRGMNNVQINSIAVSPDGSIISGANSNACPYIESRMAHHGGANVPCWYDQSGSNTNHMANIIWRGNGGSVAASRFSQYLPISRRPIFVASEGGSIGRSYADYADFTNTQTWTIDSTFLCNVIAGGPKMANIYLWETNNNTEIRDTDTYTIDTLGYLYAANGELKPISRELQYAVGDTLVVLDNAHSGYPIHHVFSETGDFSEFYSSHSARITIQKPFVSRMLAICSERGRSAYSAVAYNWVPTDFRLLYDATAVDTTTHWTTIFGSKNIHNICRQAVLSNDGGTALVVVDDDTLNTSFIARVRGLNDLDYTGNLYALNNTYLYWESSYRTTNIDTLEASLGNKFFDRHISSIFIDPREGMDAAIVTFDGYDNLEAANVIYIDNLTSDNPSITEIPLMEGIPVFSALIECTTGAIIVGTEDGVFKKESVANGTWQPYGSFTGVPVTSICQMVAEDPFYSHVEHSPAGNDTMLYGATKWPKAIYFGTYGRGVFMDSSYVTNHRNEVLPDDVLKRLYHLDIPSVMNVGENSVSLYPNPAVEQAFMDIKVQQAGRAFVRIYDLTGKVVMTEDLGQLAAGNYTRTLNCQNLQHGMYLVNLTIGNQRATSKMIVR